MGRLSPGGREEKDLDDDDVDGGGNGERSKASLNSWKKAAPPLELLLPLQLQRRFRSDRSIAKRRRDDDDIALSLCSFAQEEKPGKLK